MPGGAEREEPVLFTKWLRNRYSLRICYEPREQRKEEGKERRAGTSVRITQSRRNPGERRRGQEWKEERRKVEEKEEEGIPALQPCRY